MPDLVLFITPPYPVTLLIALIAVSSLLYNLWAIRARKQLQDSHEKTDHELRQHAESLLQLSAVVEQSPTSVVITDLDANIEFINPKFTELTGYTFEEVKGQNPRILQSGETARKVYEELWSTVTQGGVWQGELHNKKKDGSRFWERATISPICGPDGKALRYLGIKEDITEQKELEDQFRQSQKMEAIGRLAGGIAHDFNNKLQAILGNAEIALERSDLPDGLHEDLDEIKAAAKRSAELTRQLLGFARKQAVKPKNLNLNETIEPMLKMLRRLIGLGIDMQWKPDPDIGSVRLDPAQLDQILANLALNSRDAMTGNGSLIIETHNVHIDELYANRHGHVRPGGYVMVMVSDTGCGMNKQVLSHVFDPFYTTKDVGQGTGLGLPTVYGIMNQNNGFIHMYSEEGMGTCAKLYFPRFIQENAETSPDQKTTTPAKGRETILIVEDERAILDLAGAMLRRYGYKVLSACGPDEALTHAREYPDTIHLMVTDVMMPKMDGKQLKDQIARIRPETRILYMSGYAASVIAKRGIPDTGADFLQKPFSLQSLTAKVRTILDR